MITLVLLASAAIAAVGLVTANTRRRHRQDGNPSVRDFAAFRAALARSEAHRSHG